MPRTPSRDRLALSALAVIAALGWARSATLHARPGPPPEAVAAALPAGGVAGQAEEQKPPPLPQVYVSTPMTVEEARIHAKLKQRIDVPFANETPLEDFLKYIEEKTAGQGADGPGLQFYVDPIGLQEAEKTETSPVRLRLTGVPVETALKLALKQLGLVQFTQKDGLVLITSQDARDLPDDPNVLILNQLEALRSEVAELRRDVGRGRMGGMGGMGGGMQGPR